jgi:hypothetical protein
VAFPKIEIKILLPPKNKAVEIRIINTSLISILPKTNIIPVAIIAKTKIPFVALPVSNVMILQTTSEAKLLSVFCESEPQIP